MEILFFAILGIFCNSTHLLWKTLLYIRYMRFSLLALIVLFYAGASFAQLNAIEQKKEANAVVADTIYDTVYVAPDDGIPWNRSYFPPERLLRRSSIDPALFIGYTYSASFVSGSFGSFAQHSYLAEWAYEFTPNLHLSGSVGLWMPLYNNLNFQVSREDVRQGNVQVIVPNIELDYKFSENSYLHIGLYNEEDVFKAYGPMYRYYGPWRNSKFYP